MKPVGAFVSLRFLWWWGDLPEPGDHLVTKTGRRYQILERVGKRLDCVVVKKQARPEPGHREFEWQWASRAHWRKLARIRSRRT